MPGFFQKSDGGPACGNKIEGKDLTCAMEFSKNDIYSKKGILLLSKGQTITENVRNRLRSLGYLPLPEPAGTLKEEAAVGQSSLFLRSMLRMSDDELLDRTGAILNRILFESKKQPWWLYINTLSNYVNWLYTHSIDVALISEMIALGLHLETNEVALIALGALLHDIGKLMIPSKIIQKPGELTEEESFFMRQHCELGYSMVKEQRLHPIVTGIILQHHERMDGSGYPFGLKGGEIPLPSKIVIVADSLDAMTSYRPYKRPKCIRKAVEELKREEKQYPADIVSIFEAMIG